MTSKSEIESSVLRTLNGYGLRYEVVEIDPEYADTAAFCEKYGYPPEQSANTIIVGTKKAPKRFSACVVRATARLDVNHTVKKLMGNARVSFARAEDTVRLTGMLTGGVTALALPDGVPLFVDPGLMRYDWVILGGGGRSTKIKVSPDVFNRIPGARIVEGLTQES